MKKPPLWLYVLWRVVRGTVFVVTVPLWAPLMLLASFIASFYVWGYEWVEKILQDYRNLK